MLNKGLCISVLRRAQQTTWLGLPVGDPRRRWGSDRSWAGPLFVSAPPLLLPPLPPCAPRPSPTTCLLFASPSSSSRSPPFVSHLWTCSLSSSPALQTHHWDDVLCGPSVPSVPLIAGAAKSLRRCSCFGGWSVTRHRAEEVMLVSQPCSGHCPSPVCVWRQAQDRGEGREGTHFKGKQSSAF